MLTQEFVNKLFEYKNRISTHQLNINNLTRDDYSDLLHLCTFKTPTFK